MARSARPPTADPTPIPALAPALRLEFGEQLFPGLQVVEAACRGCTILDFAAEVVEEIFEADVTDIDVEKEEEATLLVDAIN